MSSFPDGAGVPPQSKVSAIGRDPAWDLIAVPVAEDGTFSEVAPHSRPRLTLSTWSPSGFEVRPIWAEISIH